MILANWPYPKIFTTEFHVFILDRYPNQDLVLSQSYLHTTGQWVKLPVLNLGNNHPDSLDIADFGPFYVVTTFEDNFVTGAVINTLFRDVGEPIGSSNPYFTLTTSPRMGTCCNFNGQFIAGNLVPEGGSVHSGQNSSSILWAGIGDMELDPRVNITSGFSWMRVPVGGREIPKILRLKKLGDRVVLYSDAGKVILSPELNGNTFTYGHNQLDGLGILRGTHIAGDDNLHGYINTQGEFSLITADGKDTRLGYKEFIVPMLEYSNPNRDTDLMVSYIKRDKRFYISNGNECLVISGYGAYKCHQLVSGVVEGWDGSLWGTFYDTLDYQGRITTDSLSFGSRGIKSVESITANISHDGESQSYLSVNWRPNTSKEFFDFPWITDGISGEAGIHVAATDFQLRFMVENYRELFINSLMVNVKFSDQRFKRGTVPPQFDTTGGTQG